MPTLPITRMGWKHGKCTATVRENSKQDKHIDRARLPQGLWAWDCIFITIYPTGGPEIFQWSQTTKLVKKINVESANERGLLDIDWDRVIITNHYKCQKMTSEEAFKHGLIDSLPYCTPDKNQHEEAERVAT